MNKILLLAATLILSLTSCNQYKIEGTSSVSSLDGKMLFVKMWVPDEMVKIDSCEIVHGKFTMGGDVDSVVMATLFMDDQAMMPMVIEKGNIKVTIDDLNLTATGTPLNDKLSEFIEKQNGLSARMEELSHKESQMIMDGKDPAEIEEYLQKEGENLSNEISKLVSDFITSNYDNVLGPGVFMILCSNMPYPVITPLMEDLLDKAPDKFRNHPFISEFVKTARENMRRSYDR